MTAPAQQTDRGLTPLLAVSAWLSAQHAADQQAVADNLTLSLFPLWQIMRFNELDASTVLWLPAVLPQVETAFLQSQRLAAVFNANVRAAELPVDVPIIFDVPDVQVPANVPAASFQLPDVRVERTRQVPRPAPQAAPEPMATPQLDAQSLRVAEQIARGRQNGTPQWVLDQIQRMDDVRTGRAQQLRVELQKFDRTDVAKSLTIEANYRTKAAMPGPEQELMHDALVRSSGAAVRQAMNGGRGVTDRVMQKDRKVIGYARVTDADPCAFCALLASQGAFFGKGSFISSDKKYDVHPDFRNGRDLPAGWTNAAKVHNNCRCTLRPVYASEGKQDAAAKHFYQLWQDLDITAAELMDTRANMAKRKKTFTAGEARKAAEIKKYRELLKDNPFDGSQFDMAVIRQELRDRKDALINAGFDPDSPQVKWAERTARRAA